MHRRDWPIRLVVFAVVIVLGAGAPAAQVDGPTPCEELEDAAVDALVRLQDLFARHELAEQKYRELDREFDDAMSQVALTQLLPGQGTDLAKTDWGVIMTYARIQFQWEEARLAMDRIRVQLYATLVALNASLRVREVLCGGDGEPAAGEYSGPYCRWQPISRGRDIVGHEIGRATTATIEACKSACEGLMPDCVAIVYSPVSGNCSLKNAAPRRSLNPDTVVVTCLDPPD